MLYTNSRSTAARPLLSWYVYLHVEIKKVFIYKKKYVSVTICSKKLFFLELLPPEAALPLSPNKSGQDFSGCEISRPDLSGREISRPDCFWPGKFPARICLAGEFPSKIFSGRVGLGSPFWVGGRGRKTTPVIYPLIVKSFFGHENSRRGSYGINSERLFG